MTKRSLFFNIVPLVGYARLSLVLECLDPIAIKSNHLSFSAYSYNHTHTCSRVRTHRHTHIYIYIYMCVCVCVCLCIYIYIYIYIYIFERPWFVVSKDLSYNYISTFAIESYILFIREGHLERILISYGVESLTNISPLYLLFQIK